MERYEYLSKVKKEQKELAKYIKELKSKRKADRRDGWSLYKLEDAIFNNKSDYRHRHIAYCLLRGRSMAEIETPRESNKPQKFTLNILLDEYEKAVRPSTD